MSKSDQIVFPKVLEGVGSKDKDILQRAYNLAEKAHEGQLRKSGEPFLIHPLAVGLSLWKKFQDAELTAAGFLHDAVEDCEWLEISVIYKDFGQRVGYIVDSVTKTENTFYKDSDEFDDERDKIFAGGMTKIGCILVKLADREHNLATLKYMPAHKQVKKSFESQSLYIPLMHIIGYNEQGATVKKCEEKFHAYIQENEIQSFKEMKNNLLNICFEDFSEDLFNAVYNNTSNVMWKMEDKAFFTELATQGWFDRDNIKLISLQGDSEEKFVAFFKICGGNSFEGLKGLKIMKGLFNI